MKKNTQKELKKKVVVALSGGVDSAVAAALLKRAGFDLAGVFMKFWSEPNNNGLIGASNNRCCSQEAEVRARKVAKVLKIPFYVFNFEKEFKKRIVDYFLKEYKAGKTPNPCVVCNKEIKFGLLLEKALALNADYVATGHYARKCEIKNYKLLMARNKNKDQSYFLWKLNQNQLKHILFPIGDYTRKEVENLAKKFRLPVLGIKKSVEICFVPNTTNDFLAKYLKEKPGRIVDAEEKSIGEHRGLWFYTLGQRKGIGLPGGPYYVLGKNLKKNLLIVTKNEKDLEKKELLAKNVNWISGREPELPIKVRAKIRYRHRLSSATLSRLKSDAPSLNSKVYSLKFKMPQRAITPGQSVVFYQGQELLGGGIIC